jgi:hypothetical protein
MGDFALNYQQLILIDTTPNGPARTWVRVAEGISSAVPNMNEDIAQDKYLGDEGYGTSDVIGAQYIITFSGHRVTDDDAQNFIFGVQPDLGEDRKTNARRYDANGNLKENEITICNINDGQGDAAAKEGIGFEFHFNGKPTITDATAAPTADVEIDTGSVVGTTRFSINMTSGNTAKYKLKSETAGTIYAGQYVAGMHDYDEGTLQSMTAACTTGAVTDSGTITTTITTAAGGPLTGGTDVVETEVVLANTTAQVVELVKTSLEAESGAGEVGGEFYVTRSDATLTLRAKTAEADDVLYDIAVVDTDTTGVVFGASAAGDAGVVNANITATAGQYLQCYEVDSNSRVVSFYEKALVSGDIAS